MEETKDMGAPTMMESHGMPLVTVLAWLRQLPKDTPGVQINITMIEQVIDDLEHVEDPDDDEEEESDDDDDEEEESDDDDDEEEESDDDDEESDDEEE